MAIRMEPAEMRSLADYLKTTAGEITECINSMNSRIDTDTQQWDGASKQSYFEGYYEILPTLRDKFPEVIESLAQQLTYAADETERTDEAIAAGFRG